MKKLKYMSRMAVASMLAVCTSCLDNGDTTFALQEGNFDEMILGLWKVESCGLYDSETDEYESDFINASNLNFKYLFAENRESRVYDTEESSYSLSWSADESHRVLTLNNIPYEIESMGKSLMILTQYGTVNDEDYQIKYSLRKIGEDAEGDDPAEDESETVVIATNGSGSFVRNGYKFTIPKGAVPKGDNGTNGSVAFSVQAIPLSELPAGSPQGITFVNGTGILANPSYFTFTSPIIINVPLKGNDAKNACLFKWNHITSSWEIVPFSAINPDGTTSVSVLELGYFVVGTISNNNFGGIKIQKSQIADGYYYYLTVTPENRTGSTSISFTSGGEDLYMANLPLGTYGVQIAREKRVSHESMSTVVEHSTVTQSITISSVLIPSGSNYSSYRGWTVLNLSNITWDEGRPASWGDETVTYGTGLFQATLNWINYSGSTTDYDLHLTTPTGTEVYYKHETGDGFELDRDMISTLGNCTENIYSISDNLPAGTYKVRVHHYSGATGRVYDCRVIMNGRVVSTYRGTTDSGYQSIYTFTLQ